MTAFAMMNPSDDRVRPKTAGELQGRRPIERSALQDALDVFGTRSAGSAEDSNGAYEQQGKQGQQGQQGQAHINDILHESRYRAMQSGGVDFHANATPLGSPARGGLPGIAGSGRAGPGVAFSDQLTPGKALLEGARGLPKLSRLEITTTGMTGGSTLTNTHTRSSAAAADLGMTGEDTGDYDDELDGQDQDVFGTEDTPARQESERQSHTPFASPFGSPSGGGGGGGSNAKRKESTTSTAASFAGGRKGSLSLRGSLCIPASSSYADTLSRSNITPKSTMALKLEVSLDKYIYKKQVT